jgi:hypothetical protein
MLTRRNLLFSAMALTMPGWLSSCRRRRERPREYFFHVVSHPAFRVATSRIIDLDTGTDLVGHADVVWCHTMIGLVCKLARNQDGHCYLADDGYAAHVIERKRIDVIFLQPDGSWSHEHPGVANFSNINIGIGV